MYFGFVLFGVGFVGWQGVDYYNKIIGKIVHVTVDDC